MSQTHDFIRGLQLAIRDAELPEFWEDYSDDSPCTFKEALNKYTDYYNSLESSDKQNQLKSLFWQQIKAVGTPVIEDAPDNESMVYFLLSRDDLKESTEKPGQKRDVYLQGDFHGYGSTLKKEQLLEQFENTDIMFHSDPMPKGALVTYYYVQLEPSHGDKPATYFYGDIAYQPPSFFPVTPEVQPENKPASKSKEEIAMVSNLFWGEDSVLVDEYCKFHKSYDQNSGFFYADSKKSVADLGFPVRMKGDNGFFGNFFADKVKSASLVLASKNDKVIDYPENQVDLDKCSRSILVFAPEDKKSIDNVVIIYDGRFYQLGNTQERLENLFDQNTLTIYVNPEKGIEEEAKRSGIQFDVADFLPGMNERTVDLKHRVDEYAKFIHEELLPELVKRGFEIPDDPSKRVLVGSSLAGTASIYMGMKYPQWFGKVVAQSPSIANREKLEDFVNRGQKPPPPEIYLSCGQFECPEHARNLGLPFAKELEEKLNIKLHINPYGHQMEGWSPDLERSFSTLGLIAAPLAKDNLIPAISVATVSSTGEISTKAKGVTSNSDPEKVTDQTIFEAASLSKPVFAYIVLKMAERGEIDLDTPLIEILEKKFGKEDPRAQFGPPFPGIRENDNYRKLTARMLLSHQAGLPNEFNPPDFRFVADAGKGFDYSGEAYRFLMEVIDKVASPKSVEILAQEEFIKIGMEHSSFIRPNTVNIGLGHHSDGKTDERQHFFGIHPAGSLHTTAEDYGKFLKTCTSDEYVRREMFSPCVTTLAGDNKGIKQGVPEGILSKIAWGFGIGLQKNRDGSTTAFHWGDGSGTCRNFAAINLSTNQAVACFTNSANGPLVFREICEPIVGNLSTVSQWLTIREGLPRPNLPAIDYQTNIIDFDQEDSGWRRFLSSNPHSQPTTEQFRQAGDSIRRYLEQNLNRGIAPEKQAAWEFSLNFHAFQMYANCNDLEMMQKFINQSVDQFKAMSIEDIEELKKAYGPTVKPYLEATMLFLSNSDNKKQLLEKKLDEILQVPINDYPDGNVVFFAGRVHDMVNNHDKSYGYIFSLPTKLPPLTSASDWVPACTPQDVSRYKEVENQPIPRAFVTLYQSSVDKSKQDRQKQETVHDAKDDVQHDTGARTKKYDQ